MKRAWKSPPSSRSRARFLVTYSTASASRSGRSESSCRCPSRAGKRAARSALRGLASAYRARRPGGRRGISCFRPASTPSVHKSTAPANFGSGPGRLCVDGRRTEGVPSKLPSLMRSIPTLGPDFNSIDAGKARPDRAQLNPRGGFAVASEMVGSQPGTGSLATGCAPGESFNCCLAPTASARPRHRPWGL